MASNSRTVISRPGRSYERIGLADLRHLGQIAAEDRDFFYRRHPEYRDRLVCLALCQGAAKHFVDMKRGVKLPNGVKDFDVWSFFAAVPGQQFPAAIRHRTSTSAPPSSEQSQRSRPSSATSRGGGSTCSCGTCR